MSTQTGYYALLQLAPLPDSEEAVNVGVYLLCPQAGWAELASLPELPSRARAMFPDLSEWLYALALEQLAAQLAQVTYHLLCQPPSEWLAQAQAHLAPEEGILHLSALHHVSVTDPAQTLSKLFEHHVRQTSAVEKGALLLPLQNIRVQQGMSNSYKNSIFTNIEYIFNMVDLAKVDLANEIFTSSLPSTRNEGVHRYQSDIRIFEMKNPSRETDSMGTEKAPENMWGFLPRKSIKLC